MTEYNPLEEALKGRPSQIEMNKFENASEPRRFERYQPERSKREDVNCPQCGLKLTQHKIREMLLFCIDCRKSFYESELRCGALNTMET
jgi:hypothetical protein